MVNWKWLRARARLCWRASREGQANARTGGGGVACDGRYQLEKQALFLL